MKNGRINNTCNYPSTFEELRGAILKDPSGRYKHFKIVFHRYSTDLNLILGKKYLVVDTDGFNMYQLKTINYKNGMLQMIFTSSIGKTIIISHDINDEQPKYFFIDWDDLNQLMLEENVLDFIDDELLELEKDNEEHFN